MRRCTICLNKRRPEIDRAVISREMGYRAIAKRFRISHTALYRHVLRHLPTNLIKKEEQTREEAANGLIAELDEITQKTVLVLARAMDKKDGDLALRALARRERQLELKARLLGQLEDRDRGPQKIEVQYVDKAVIVAGGGSRLTLPAANVTREEEGNGTT